MSTIKVDTIQHTSGISTSSTNDIHAGRAKAWVNFNGSGSVSIRDHFNVSSITDNGTGNYNVNYATAITSANDCAVAWGMRSTGSDSNYICWRRSTPSVSSINVRSTHVWSSGGTNEDLQFYYVVVFCN